jgi:hypothetical protein
MKKAAKKNPQVRAGKRKAGPALADLFETDEVAWLERSRDLIQQDRYRELDYAHLAEYLDDMAKRDKREVKSRLKTLLVHLLKWQFQPDARSVSWDVTITNQREELEELFSSATLRNHAAQILDQVFELAVKQAAKETGLARDRFPGTCPYSLAELLQDILPRE